MPGRLPDDRLQPSRREPFGLLGRAAFATRPALLGAGGLGGGGGGLRAGGGPDGSRPQVRDLAIERRRLAAQAFALGPPFEDRLGGTERDPEVADHRGPVAWHGDPAGREHGLDGQTRVKIRQPGRPGQDAPGRPAGVATDRGIERATTGRGQGLAKAALAWIVSGGSGGGPLRDDERAALADEGAAPSRRRRRRHGSRPPGPLRPRPAAPGSIARSSSSRRPPTRRAARAIPRVSSSASLASRPSSRARTAVADALAVTASSWAVTRAASVASACSRAASRRATAVRSASMAVVSLARAAARSASRPARPSDDALAWAVASIGASLDLGQPPAGGLVLGLARRRGTPEGGQLLALCLARGAQRPELGEGVGQLAVRLGEHPLEVEIARRDRCRQRATSGGQLGFGRGPFLEQPPPIAFQRLELRGEARVADLRRADGGLRRVMGLASLAFERGADGELAGQRGRRGLCGDERGHRPIGGVTRRVAIRLGDGQPSGGLVPARVHREQQGARELVRG